MKFSQLNFHSAKHSGTFAPVILLHGTNPFIQNEWARADEVAFDVGGAICGCTPADE
jgi:hypothetical protein